MALDPRRPLNWDAVLSRLMDSLTGGAFLAGLAVFTGASNLQLGMLAAMPFLAQVVQLPAVALLLRVQDRRRVVVAMAGMARLLWILIGILVVTVGLSTGNLVLIVAISSSMAVVATAAWNWWMRDLLPPAALGSFFGQRLRRATLAAMVVMLMAGGLVDALGARGQVAEGYGILFVLGGLLGLGGVYALGKTPHESPPPSPPIREAFSRMAAAAHGSTLRLGVSLGLTGAAVSFALPFAAVYMLRSLGFSLLTATFMAAISQLAYLAGLRGWALISDRHGDRPLALISLTVLTATMMLWVTTGWDSGWPLLVAVGVLHFLSGYALSGIELSTNNLMLRSAPSDNAAAFLSMMSVLRAAAAGFGVLASGIVWNELGRGPLWSTTLPWMGPWELRGFQVLCGISIAICVAALAATARLREPTQPLLIEVVRAVRREVHDMSSIAGMRTFIHAVSYSVEFMAAPFAGHLRKDRQGPK